MTTRETTVIDVLTAKHVPFDVLHHRQTFTAADEAATLHVAEGEVLKTVVIDTGAGHVIAVVLASSMLAMDLVRGAVADAHAHLAGELEMERDFPTFELGALPPLPSLTKVPVFVDPEVMLHPTVIFAVDHETSVRVKTEDLFGAEYVTVTPVVRHYAGTGAAAL